MAPILQVKDLSATLDGEQIVRGFSFSLEEGDALAVVGPNGAGKTVLLKVLLGMVPHAGTVAWREGVKLGYVPQKIDADRHLPVNLGNLLEAKARVLRLSKRDIAEAIESVELSPSILKTPIGHLSGGQFQKALITFALLGKPDAILFDEPTASLDQLSEEHVYELIHRLEDRYGITVLLVSHDLSVVYHYATKVLCVNREMICFGAPEEALMPETLERLYARPHKYFHHLDTHHA